ncbi:small GTP-binding protein [Histomonas meleagridis]|uniref:small GTP-binding protein n=1 Tax=Histomonas meleagridis TaxID=135588 RepID=UPI00355A30FC|nr:small GTP-binding protein [Histomonas meleagridis]KAH0798568.1 small GTP-binding protein [Histomonas meleagridis]
MRREDTGLEDPLTVRVVLIGDTQVGKTSLVYKFVRSNFEEQQRSTIGAVFHTYEQSYNGNDVVMQIWDTAGQEKYRSLGPIYYRDAAAGICVFDMTNKDSFLGIEKWINEFKKHTVEPIIYLVGNKVDIDDKIAVDKEEALKFAESQGAKLFFSSAKTGQNVKEIFTGLFNDLCSAGKFDTVKKLPEKNNEGSNCC